MPAALCSRLPYTSTFNVGPPLPPLPQPPHPPTFHAARPPAGGAPCRWSACRQPTGWQTTASGTRCARGARAQLARVIFGRVQARWLRALTHCAVPTTWPAVGHTALQGREPCSRGQAGNRAPGAPGCAAPARVACRQGHLARRSSAHAHSCLLPRHPPLRAHACAASPASVPRGPAPSLLFSTCLASR